MIADAIGCLKKNGIRFFTRFFSATVCIVVFLCPPGVGHAATIYFQNGLTHVIDYSNYAYDDVFISQHTTIGLITGGAIGRTIVYDTSVLSVDNGSVLNQTDAFDSSQINVTAGNFGSTLFLHNSSNLVMNGGNLGMGLGALDNSHFEFNNGQSNSITMNGNSSLLMTGGQVNRRLAALDSGSIDMQGGNVGGGVYSGGTSVIRISGGTFGPQNQYGLYAADQGLINIMGTGFSIDGNLVGYGAISKTSGLLSGTLASGEQFSVNFYQKGATPTLTGTIVLTEVPLPSAILMFGSGLLGLMGMGHRKVVQLIS